jgi:excisionase family DNA binding protein
MNELQSRMAFSVDEAAQQANVGRDKIYAAIRDGSLPARKAGRRTLIRRCDLEAYLSNLPTLYLISETPTGDLQDASKNADHLQVSKNPPNRRRS